MGGSGPGFQRKPSDPLCFSINTENGALPSGSPVHTRPLNCQGAVLKQRQGANIQSPKKAQTGISYGFLCSYDIVRAAGGQLAVFFLLLCPLTRQSADILRGSERTICHCRQRRTVLPSQLSSRCNSIQLLYTLRMEDGGQGRGGGTEVCICARMTKWGVLSLCVCESVRASCQSALRRQ